MLGQLQLLSPLNQRKEEEQRGTSFFLLMSLSSIPARLQVLGLRRSLARSLFLGLRGCLGVGCVFSTSLSN